MLLIIPSLPDRSSNHYEATSLWSFTMEFHGGLPVYLAVVGISQAIDYYRKYRERELQASNLETRLAEAQLDALRMQLHPHFLLPSAFHPAIQPLRPAETVVYPKSVSDFVDSAYRARA
jgi:hypothetical protein